MIHTTLKDLQDETLDILEPPERLSVSEAAAKYRMLNNVGSYVGPWKNETVPYMVEPMNTLMSRDHKACIFVGPAQSGKTDALLINWALHNITGEGADQIIYQTSMNTSRDFSRQRVRKLHEYSPRVKSAMLGTSSADNAHYKRYKNGATLTLSWPSISELSGRPVGLVALTDYDRMDLDIDGEGSPFDLARKRTTTFDDFAMTLAESSPGWPVTNAKSMPKHAHEAPAAPGIAGLYNRGDMRRWYWPCLDCGEYYQPTFRLLTWVDSSDVRESAESAKMTCPHCGGAMDHGSKHDVNQAGIWVPHGMKVDDAGRLHGVRPRNSIASFWLYGVSAAFASWETLVENYIKAEQEYERTGDQEALKATVNTDQGDVYFPRGVGNDRSAEELKARAIDFGQEEPTVPEGVRFLVATVDVQASSFVVQIQGVIPPEQNGGLFDGVVIDRFSIKKSNRFDDDGDRLWVRPGSYIEDWNLITEQVITRSYPLNDESGRRMYIKNTLCDSGGVAGVTANAYLYWHKLRSGHSGKFILVKGRDTLSAPRVIVSYPDNSIKGLKPELSGQTPILLINSNKIKDALNNYLDRKERGGTILFSSLLKDNFYSELTAETRGVDGKWTNPKKLRNESTDLLYYFLAFCYHMRIEQIDWSKAPAWAEGWDENILVFSEKVENKLAPQKNKSDNSISDLARILG